MVEHADGARWCKLTRLHCLWVVRVAGWISCRFVIDLGAHTLSSLVVRSVCVGCFVILYERLVRFACVPVSDDSVLYCGLYHG